jgi:hypothetical protein
MKTPALLASTAVALLWCAAPVTAQMQQKEPAEKAAPSPQRDPGQGAGEKKDQGAASRGETQRAEPKGKAAKESAQERGGADGRAGSETKDKADKGTAEKKAEPRKSPKGAAEKAEPKDRATKGTAEKAEPKDRAAKGTAEKGAEPKDKATKGTAEKGEPKDKATKGAEKGTAGRVQLSEEQRGNVGQTILKERRVNRATNVTFSINVGTRVPRSVRLAALPVTVVSIVPAYRSYRYFVVDDRICIVDPVSYEIVEIITVSGQTAHGPARLVLTEEERAIILREVDVRAGGSTLGLGAFEEGAEVPRGVQVRTFPSAIVQKVPKVRDYKFFTAEDRLAIVDRQGAKVVLVIEDRR